MSLLDRLRATHIWVVPFIASLILLAGTAISIFSEYQAGKLEYLEYQRNVEALRREAALSIAAECLTQDHRGETAIGCLAEQLYGYQQRYGADRDLEAQQSMARWSFWAAFTSGVGLLVSIAGFVALVISLRQTRDAISLDREVGHSQTRAYLTVKPQGFDSPDQVATILLVNSGQSPARNVAYIAAWAKLNWPIESEPGYYIVPQQGQMIPTNSVGPGLEIEIRAHHLPTLDEGDDNQPCLIGVVIYDDVFKRRHRLRFLVRVGTSTFAGKNPGLRYSFEFSNFHNDEVDIT